MSFSVTDLFIVGLGLDITGALLLVRGLLLHSGNCETRHLARGKDRRHA